MDVLAMSVSMSSEGLHITVNTHQSASTIEEAINNKEDVNKLLSWHHPFCLSHWPIGAGTWAHEWRVHWGRDEDWAWGELIKADLTPADKCPTDQQ